MIDRIEGRSIWRTGWHTAARVCPTHGVQLELCFDESRQGPDTDRIRWRCDACVGSWLESYFLRDDTPRGPWRLVQLRLPCPRCNGRIRHDCTPGCCTDHRCLDCDSRFRLYARQIRASNQGPWQQRPTTLTIALAMARYPVVERSGCYERFRRCDRHRTPMELVMIGRDSPEVVGWYCGQCDRAYPEASYRQRPRYFVSDGSAALDCPACREPWGVVNPTGVPTCLRCAATYELELADRED